MCELFPLININRIIVKNFFLTKLVLNYIDKNKFNCKMVNYLVYAVYNGFILNSRLTHVK